MIQVSGWGRYPSLDAELLAPLSASRLARATQRPGAVIVRGLGRSYGDSSLSSTILSTRYLDHYIDFDPKTGKLHCESGVALANILQDFVPRGWFLPVTPGTRFVTVGGAIASDVHGKNHHVAGSFSDHVESIDLALGNGELVRASATENLELFRATCGGMGLTGAILSATLRLNAIVSSQIVETTLKAPNLETAIAAFSEHANSTYSVAWIDCLARGRNLGRSLIMLGEHADDGPLEHIAKPPIPIPIDLPRGLLHPAMVKTFNSLYYRKVLRTPRTRRVPLDRFFYPLDALANWNRLYGKQGFVQYQFVIPLEAGMPGLHAILERIAASAAGSFLAVLKVFGQGNNNLLSFPMPGYTLALDFQVESRILALLDELDRVVVAHGGRIYLAKDSRMSATTFRAGYPRWQEFEAVRARHYAIGTFASVQSKRLGLA